MPAGFYTHTATVLFARVPSLDALASVLDRCDRRALRNEAKSPWFGTADLLVAIDPERNGELVLDVVARPWPDAMGEATDPALLAAWSFGVFGRRTFPGALARAASRAPVEIELAARYHVAFARLRTTYVIGAEGDAPLVPDGHSHFTDLGAITACGLAVLGLEGAIGYFDPEGEVLLSRDVLASILTSSRDEERPAIEAWSSVRVHDLDAQHAMLDTVGMDRLDLPDLEMALAPSIDADEMVGFARDTCRSLARGTSLADGDTLAGPSGPYRVELHDESQLAPPRRVLRIVPV